MSSRIIHQTAILFFVAVCVSSVARGDDPSGDAAREILDIAGVDGGLVIHVGCGAGQLTAALHTNDRLLVHGLDRDSSQIKDAREYIREQGLYGVVSVDQLIGSRLPYVDNLARLIVVEKNTDVDADEVMRVLAPNGVACIRDGDEWITHVKPRPDNIDQWTHYLHDSSGNAVAADNQIRPPKQLRWTAAPLWSRSHEFNPSINALVSAAGRMFYILDEGIPGLPDLRFPARWSVVARDAFSGVTLWKRPIPNWGYREWNTIGMWSAPLTLNRRLVTDGKHVFVTLGYQASVSVLDARTGEVVGEIPESAGTDEIVLCDGTLLMLVREKLSVAAPPKKPPTRRVNAHEWTIGAPGAGVLTAVDITSNKVLWKSDAQSITVLTPAALNQRVCYHADQKLHCLSLETGEPLWSVPCRAAPGSRHSGGTLVMQPETVLFTSADGLTAFSLNDGSQRWTSPRVGGPGISHPPDLFVAGGLVWGGDYPKVHTRDRTAVVREGRDLITGEVKKTIQVDNLISPLHHFRCYRSKATEDFLLLTKRGVEFVDLNGDDHMRHDWLRAMCHYGFMPCNGLLYFPPHHCFCYPGVKMNGFLALAGDREGESVPDEPSAAERLIRGPGYDLSIDHFESEPAWPTYRRDNLRSGHTDRAVWPDKVPDNRPPLVQNWRASLGAKLSQPIAVGDALYVAATESHRVCCVDAATGDLRWAFTAGGRVDSAPTYHHGRLLFGCRDGWVYCLKADDGQLIWRFRAAPREGRIVAFDQVESPWPVPGSVLMLNETAYVCAGRSSYLDSGLYLYGLDPLTGKVKYATNVHNSDPDVHDEVGRPFDMEGAKSDILVTDGTNLYLLQMTFDQQLNTIDTPRESSLGDRISGLRLIATGGFLEDMWYDRTFWVYSKRWPGFYYANDAPKAGQILVFDENTTYGLHVFRQRARLSPSFKPGTGCELFADDNSNEPVLTEKSINREKGPGFSRSAPPLWSKEVPVRALAMVLAGEHLFLAGPPDAMPEDDPYASFEGRLGARLWTVSAADGVKISEQPLDCLPVFDGLIAVDGRLYMATKNGELICFSAARSE